MKAPANVLGRAADLARAACLRWTRLRRVERGSRAGVLAHQRERLQALLDHAGRSSPFYRERWGGKTPRADCFDVVEPVTKQELLDRGFEAALTDRSLSRALLQRFVGSMERNPYVVIATSGTTGEPVMMPYSRAEWVEGMAFALRGQSRHTEGILRIARVSRRMAAVLTQNPIHASTQLRSSFGDFPASRLSLAAGEPLSAQLRRLDTFQPTLLTGYPSALDALAKAQIAGELKIRPCVVMTGGETVSTAFRERVRAAWGIDVFDCYGLTETLLIAWECREHKGLHIDEDAVLLEVVDCEGRVLPPGERGDSILLTNLFNRTLPVIRYRVTDRLTVTDEPCACGLPFARIIAIDGRKDEALSLRAPGGGVVEVHAIQVETLLEEMPDVRRFQIRRGKSEATLLVVPRGGAGGLKAAVEQSLARLLASLGAAPDAIRVEIVSEIEAERGATDKRRRVV